MAVAWILQHSFVWRSLGVFRLGQGTSGQTLRKESTDLFLQANYVAAELRHPAKQLPLSINTAIPTIIMCYVAANAVYYVLLPWKDVSTTDAAAVVSLQASFGA